jgi:alpha-amylase/alpha-mannosidase (GH57 family)
MERYLCIHGHFYQPPRENPWLEAVELQDSAYPYHDWNERVTAECYGPNSTSRILNGDGLIEKIVNNYKRISFNFGPTLFSWLEEREPEVYRAILEADRESRDAFSGHGSALAQGYNHIILPLANRRDKHTQVLWGIRDFECRFGRKPEGMWLPETAVDVESLQILKKAGILFTVLAPHQAARVRKKGGSDWQDVSGGRIDPTMPYEFRLPSGQKICLFFYDGPISRAVAFEGLLRSGEVFAERLLGGFPETPSSSPRLVHIATDGETYGHHHHWGEMALSFALQHIDSNRLARVTNYGEFLEIRPPTHEVEIIENTSWSCIHGIERWRGNCGCNSGGHPGWNQEWRAPLREALDGLRDELSGFFETTGRALLKNPWAARDEYVEVILDRSPENVSGFLGRHATRELSGKQATEALKLLEIQRYALLMYTSCGWFFDELSGIETVQVLQYAGRALQLSLGLSGGGTEMESRFLERLERARSNLPEHRDGRHVYDQFVRPGMLDLQTVGAHYAVSSLFEPYEDRARLFCYEVEREEYRSLQSGEARLATGRIRVASTITREEERYSIGVLHLGDHNVSGGIREYRGEEGYAAILREIGDAFRSTDLPETLRAIDRAFGARTYSLKILFRDLQRKVLKMLLNRNQAEVLSIYHRIYEQNALFMRFLSEIGHPLPRSFHVAAELAIGTELRRIFEADEPDLGKIDGLLEEAAMFRIPLDEGGLAYALARNAERIALQLRAVPFELPRLQLLEGLVGMGLALPFRVNFWKTQDLFHEMLQTAYPGILQRAAEGDEGSKAWVRHFAVLGERLSIRMPQG